MGKKFSDWKRRTKPKIKRFLNILLGLAIFMALTGSAFKISFLFGSAFIVAFALAIYKGELKSKPWKPLAIFVGALIIRYGLDYFLDPIFSSETAMDIGVSALIFLAVIIFGWKIKRS